MLEIKTNGKKSSEFWLNIATLAVIVFLVIGRQVLKWEINENIYYIFGAVAVSYSGGRTFYKGKKVKALGDILSNGAAKQLLESALGLLKGVESEPEKTEEKDKKK